MFSLNKAYIDKRRQDRLDKRSITFRNKDLVKKLDAYCLLTDTKITTYVEDAVKTKLMFDIDNIQVQLKGDEK